MYCKGNKAKQYIGQAGWGGTELGANDFYTNYLVNSYLMFDGLQTAPANIHRYKVGRIKNASSTMYFTEQSIFKEKTNFELSYRSALKYAEQKIGFVHNGAVNTAFADGSVKGFNGDGLYDYVACNAAGKLVLE